MRIGFGFDVHPLAKGRKLILGGVEIPYVLGLQGHSDADVLVHAICDSLLGAMGEKDIGHHFPNSDPRYRGVSSLRLLEQVREIMVRRSFGLGNLDSTVVAEEPKIAPYIPEMIAKIAQTLHASSGQVNIKATTAEGLGFVGEKKGIVAYATALLVSTAGGKT
ncbi:MAG: ispDF [Deltaproteobacteria bacterium]|jgi:2-C-methyl-D-erythritol 2,4-cyclodiphosphate synthase|nr:ispDF [Deltaproteobacteria bacterium]MBP1717676.1 ispDF [Deltaproteobacteria bacterium]